MSKRRGPSAHRVEMKSHSSQQGRVCMLEGITVGEVAVAEGGVVTHAEAKQRLARWLE